MKRFLREQSLSLIFLALFVAALAGQSVAGWHAYNEDELAHAQLLGQSPETISFGRYLTSSSFAQAVTENWQSEYLQFTLFILAHRLVHPEGLDGVQAAGGGGRRERRAADARRARQARLAALGQGGRMAALGLLELARPRDGHDLALVVARAVLHAAGASTTPSSSSTSRSRSSWLQYLGLLGLLGGARCRTGSRSSSPSARWPCSPSTCASAARRSPSPSAARTTRRARRARRRTARDGGRPRAIGFRARCARSGCTTR